MHNCGRGYDATMMALEKGIVWGADVVMMQEQVVEREGYNISHPGYRLIRGGRTMTAIRRDTHLEFSEVDVGGEGDVQVFDVKYPSGIEMRLVNVYDQLRQEEGRRSQGRPAQTARWKEIMGRSKILLGGDWNAHSDRWDPECPPKRDEVFLTNLMDEYDLTDVTDGEATHTSTRNGEVSTSLIDFFITKARMADRLEIATDLATTSDHAIVCAHLRWDERERAKVSRKVTGWDIDGLKSEKENYEKAQKYWKDKSLKRPVLTEESSEDELQKEAEWIQRNFANHLNRCCKKVKVCARSKRWWNEEIAENRRILGSLKRARRRGEAMQQQVKKQRSNVRRIIRQSKKKMWQEFLSSATRDQVWQALRYTKPGGQQTTKALKSKGGVVAESWEDKAELIKEEAFPKPLKGVDRKAQEEGGGMWKTITEEDIRLALFDQSVKKAPGPDRLGFKEMRLLWEWDAHRIIAIVKTSFRLGIHPRVWKEAKGVVIPKPNKPNYGVAKAYRVITLLNCLGKVVEKVAANAIADQCERRQLLHDGQFGCRKRRSAIDAVGRLMKRVEEAWERGNTAAVLLMDVKGAFPHVAKGNLIKRMEEMGFEADLVRWVESFMEERKVIMSMDGKEGDSMDVETGVPQGSPVSPVLFVIYLSGLFGRVEEKEEECGSEGISFVDDVAWVVEGEDVGECTQRLERCAVEAQIWAKENACQFDIEKTEAILFTRRINNKEPKMKARIRVGNHEVQYNKEATRWLGVWLDSMLTLNDHTKKTFARARRAQARVRSLMVKKGLSPEGCQRIQIAALQAVALYGAELWWKGQKNKAQEVQKILNEQGRRVTGCFGTTPQGALMNDAGLRPANALLNNRVRRYKMRQMMMPDASGGGRMLEMEGNVVHRVEGIDELIPEDYPLEWRRYEGTTLSEVKKRLKGQVIIQDEEQALEEARKERDGLVFWTDGSRKEDEWVGCAVVWKEGGRWNKRRVHLGRQKEAFDAEMYAMSEAVKIADEICEEKEARRVTVFTDSQATLRRIQSDEPGPGQALALRTMNWESELTKKNIRVEYRWVPAHKGVEGNEEADLQATKAAYKHCGSYTETQNPLRHLNYVSFAHIS
jgi:ribonuclease HI